MCMYIRMYVSGTSKIDTLLGMNNSQNTEAVRGCTLSMCVCVVERLLSTLDMMIHTLPYIRTYLTTQSCEGDYRTTDVCRDGEISADEV